nr:hypothetical protein [Fusobacterium pseudoperiodonticum]
MLGKNGKGKTSILEAISSVMFNTKIGQVRKLVKTL